MIKRLLYFLNVCILLVLLMACLCCYIAPAIAWPLSFLGLGFIYIIGAVIVCLIFCVLIRSKFAWVNVIALLLSIPFLRTVVGFHFAEGEEKGIKIMSYNVRNFDLYNWSGNKKTRAKIMDLIHQESPDVICFQEFYTDTEEFQNAEYISDSLGYKYHYLHVTYDSWYKNTSQMKWHHLMWGLAIFSRYEIKDTGTVPFAQAGNNQCIYADLSVDGKPLRVYDTHLQSIHLNYDENDAIEELSENQSTSWYRLRNIIKKMKHALPRRAAQAQSVRRHLSQYQGQKLICGDFNDSPVSYTYHTISEGMQDAFVCRGKGLGKTFATGIGSFRIDFVLTDPSVRVNSYRTIPIELSDHYPVVTRLSI